MKPAFWQIVSGASLIALILLCVLWEAVLAPLRPGGTWLTLKALPLLTPLAGVLRGRLDTYQWSSMLILLYLAEGLVRAWSEQGLPRILAFAEITLSLIYFFSAIYFVRSHSRTI